MQTRTITPNLTQLTRMHFVNAYLVREDDGLTLVDTMLGRSADGMIAAANSAGAPIRRIALTHGHGDHVGSLDALAERLPDAEIAISVRESRLLAGDRELDPDEATSKIRGSWPKVSTVPARLLEPGDRVGSLRVIAAPGHTPGHIALLDDRDGTLIAGDAYSTLAGISTGGHTNRRFPLVAMATWDRETANRTAVSLRALDPEALAVGHGPVIVSPGAAMDRALAAAGATAQPAA
jgi:glyoxylase-like metal-dependent hydrolase (beta-lactamase superfamily II)